MNRDISAFIDKYVKEIKDNNAAMFIGAGFSKSAGYVDWKNLLRSVAEDLGLDVDKEYDLVSLAQYCYNKNGNRSLINDTIFDEFSKEKDITIEFALFKFSSSHRIDKVLTKEEFSKYLDDLNESINTRPYRKMKTT